MTSRSSLYGPADQPDHDAAYYPDATWQHRTPSESGVSPDLLKQAIDFAVAGETKAPRDLVMNHYQNFGREPFGYAIGPIKERGDPTGIIIRKGYIVAEWGDPLRVDMTHNVTKSFETGDGKDKAMPASRLWPENSPARAWCTTPTSTPPSTRHWS